MASISLKHIYKVYNNKVLAVNDFSMEIENNEFIVFVGPSGCGKSTTLRMIAGLEDITAGELLIDGKIVNDLEPIERNIAMVFQNYALYPHMSVFENMAFSLRTSKTPSDVIYEKVLSAANILGITDYLDRLPKHLSGGQRQRVALGRAIVRNPKVFLLDEPLSNLDAKLRTQMRKEITNLHEKLNTTFIYVTHDQVEAMTMGTRIVVMKDGIIQQIDTPVNIYNHPNNMFVASFIGTPQMNFLKVRLKKENNNVNIIFLNNQTISINYKLLNKVPLKYFNNQEVILGIRPDDLIITTNNYKNGHSLKVKVLQLEILGKETVIYATLNLLNDNDKDALITVKSTINQNIKKDDIITIEPLLDKIHIFDNETTKSIKNKIPLENIIYTNILENKLYISNQSIFLPKALRLPNKKNVEVILPTEAVILDKGEIKATIENIEYIDNKYIYTLNVGDITLFTITINKLYNINDTICIDLDFSLITIKEENIYPISRINKLNGFFTKKKLNNKDYSFLLNIDNKMIESTDNFSEKLFLRKGVKIFKTQLIYQINTKDIKINNNETKNSIKGKIIEVYDYGNKVYSKILLTTEYLIVEYSGKVNDIIYLEFDIDKINVIDKINNIILI